MRSSNVAAALLALLLLSPLPAVAAEYGQMIDQFLASVKAGKKPAGTWAILGFAFDDKMDEDVEEFAHHTLARK